MTLRAPALDARPRDLPPPATWAWRITWGGKSWTDQDLTVRHLGVLTILSGDDDWEALDVPTKLAVARQGVLDGYMRLVNMVAAFVAVDRTPESMPAEEAQAVMTATLAELSGSTVDDIFGAVVVQS